MILEEAMKALVAQVRQKEEQKKKQDEKGNEKPLIKFAPSDSLRSVTRDLKNLSISADNCNGQLKFLKDLHFNGMFSRQDHVTQAHPQTFQYMFKNNFSHWLKSQNERIFWISGKPGSGKSTLMKYLVHQNETAHLLQSWANSRTLYIVSHFFWINGSELQRSLVGLLRVIVFDIFRKHPDLIPTSPAVMHPDAFYSATTAHGFHTEWTWDQLHSLFQNIVEDTRDTHCFCIFVDGLDEFNGEQQDLIHAIRGFSTGSNVKFCVASRPWNVFEQAFGDGSLRKIYLQNLNKPDIARFVKDTLQSRSDF
jgi:hypothetical protein